MKRIASILLCVSSLPLSAATFTVTNTDDSGPGSLRQALTDAQLCVEPVRQGLGDSANGFGHLIAFDVPSGLLTNGVAVITPLSPLPAITCPGTTVDGTTQTANGGNTNDVTLGTGGTVGTGPDGRTGTGDEPALPQLNGPEVEIDGRNLSGAILTVQADAVTIRGLALHGGGDFSGVGTGSGNIDVQSGTGALIEANVLGTGATSYTNPGGAGQTQNNLIRITGGSNVTIQKNLLGFTRWRSIVFLSPAVDTVTIEQNEFNGSFDGVDFGNPGIGPTGTVTISRNLFHDSIDNGSGSSQFALFVTQTFGGFTVITDNSIHRFDYGALIEVSGPSLVERNVISESRFWGVAAWIAISLHDGSDGGPGSGHATIRRNSIFDNGDLGIDLAPFRRDAQRRGRRRHRSPTGCRTFR